MRRIEAFDKATVKLMHKDACRATAMICCKKYAFTTIGTMSILAMSKSGTRASRCWSGERLTLLPACASFPID